MILHCMVRVCVFYTYFYNYYNSIFLYVAQSNEASEEDINDDDLYTDESIENESEIDIDSSVSNDRGIATAEELQSGNAKWILKVGETKALTRTAVNGVIQDASDLVQDVTEELKRQVFRVISDNGIDPTTLNGLTDVFSALNPICTPFNGLATFQQQKKYYRENFHFVVSILAE